MNFLQALLTGSLISSVAWADDPSRANTPTPFEAHYTASYNGTTFEDAALRRLERLGNGEYLHRYEAEHLLYFAREESRLTLNGCEAHPIEFKSERGNLFRRKIRTLRFDWGTKMARYDNDGEQGTFAISPGVLDPMSAHLSVACQAGTVGTITVQETDHDHIEARQYVIIGRESIETPDGKQAAIKVERKHANPDRKTLMWLAADNPVMVYKIWQRDSDGSIYELVMTDWKPLATQK